MKYAHYEFDAQAGIVAEVSLDRPAKVLLLDPLNYSSYRAGRRCRGQGGVARLSPLRLQVPHEGRWHVVVEPPMGTTVRHSMRLVA
jgi:Domain of unknown function (DUF1883)